MVVNNASLSIGSEITTLVNIFTDAFLRVVGAETNRINFLGTTDYPKGEKVNDFDLISLFGSNLYIYVFQLMMPLTLAGVVYEKELKLREIMKMMGLRMGPYWLVTYFFYYFQYLLIAIFTWVMGAVLGIR